MLYLSPLPAATVCPSPTPGLGLPLPTAHDPAAGLMLLGAGALTPCGTMLPSLGPPDAASPLCLPAELLILWDKQRRTLGFLYLTVSPSSLLPHGILKGFKAYLSIPHQHIPGDSNHSLTRLHIRDAIARDTSGKRCNQVRKLLIRNPSDFCICH